MRPSGFGTQFRLINAFIAVVFLFVLGFVVLSLVRGAVMLAGGGGGAPEKEAVQWAHGMGLSPAGIQCARLDTDNDGYVSCSVSVKKVDGSLQIYPIECAAVLSWNQGCRLQKPAGTIFRP